MTCERLGAVRVPTQLIIGFLPRLTAPLLLTAARAQHPPTVSARRELSTDAWHELTICQGKDEVTSSG